MRSRPWCRSRWSGGITGVVWRDFKPGGGTPGKVEKQELGLPGVTVELRDDSGKQVADTTTEPDGTFKFEDVEGGDLSRGDRRRTTFRRPTPAFRGSARS